MALRVHCVLCVADPQDRCTAGAHEGAATTHKAGESSQRAAISRLEAMSCRQNLGTQSSSV